MTESSDNVDRRLFIYKAKNELNSIMNDLDRVYKQVYNYTADLKKQMYDVLNAFLDMEEKIDPKFKEVEKL